MPGSPGCPVVKVKSEYLRGSPSPGTPKRDIRGIIKNQDSIRDLGSDRASPDSVFPDVISSRVSEDQHQRSCTPAPARSSPQSPLQAVSTTPMSQEASSRGESPDGGNHLSSAQSKEESDNSVFDGGGPDGGPGGGNNGNNRSDSSNQSGQRSSPSSQFNPNLSPSTNSSHGNHMQTPPTPPRLRAPSVPPHILSHHQFWPPGTVSQNFATQRLLNGVISSAVNYAQNLAGSSNNGSGGNIGAGNGSGSGGGNGNGNGSGGSNAGSGCEYQVNILSF